MQAAPPSAVHSVRINEPVPVVLVTSAGKGKAGVMAMSRHMMLQFEPSLVGCVISNRNHTFSPVKASKEYMSTFQRWSWRRGWRAAATSLGEGPTSSSHFVIDPSQKTPPDDAPSRVKQLHGGRKNNHVTIQDERGASVQLVRLSTSHGCRSLSPFSTVIIPSPLPPPMEFDYNPWNL